MRLNTTTDIETDDASATVNQIQTRLSETEYRLNVTDDAVRLYASMGTTTTSVDDDVTAMLGEINALDGVEITEGDIEIGGQL